MRLPRAMDLALWSLPVLVGVAIRYQAVYPELEPLRLAVAMVAAGIVYVGYRRPMWALTALVIGLPFQLFAQSWLFARGLPLNIVRPAGYWKEALALGLCIAAWRDFAVQSRRLDAIDKIAFGFLTIVGAYALFPTLFASLAPTDLTTRYVASRQICGYVVLFLACRHLKLPEGSIARLGRTAVVVASVTAVVVFYEVAFSDQWNSFVVDTIRLPRWFDATGRPLERPDEIRIYSGGTTLRAASVFATADYATYLLLPLALCLHRSMRPRAGPRPVLIAGLLAVALVFTQTRNGILAGAIIAVFTLWFSRHSYEVAGAAKARFALVLFAGAVLFAPLASSSGVVDRFQAFVGGTDESSSQHRDSIDRGLSSLAGNPFGNGLGTGVGAGQRYGTVVVSADNGYLYIGNEVGVLALMLYVALSVVVVPLRLRGESGRDPSSEMAAIRTALIAIAIVSVVMQPWVDLAISWTFWCLAGVALADYESRKVDDATALRHDQLSR